MAKSKCISIVAWDKGTPDTYGNTKHNVKFEDGTEGIYNGKKEKPYFAVGKESEYEVEDKAWSNGQQYKKITPPKKSFAPNTPGGSPTPPVAKLFNLKSKCLDLSIKTIRLMEKHCKLWIFDNKMSKKVR